MGRLRDLLLGARRMSLGPALAVDAVAVAGLAVFHVIGTTGAATQAEYAHRAPGLLAYALGLLAAAVLLARHAYPVAVLVVTALLTVAYFALDYPYGPMPLPFCVAAYQLAAGNKPAGDPGLTGPARPRPTGVGAVFALTGASLAVILTVEYTGLATDPPGGSPLPTGFVEIVPPWLITAAAPLWIGFAVRARRSREVEASRRRAAEDRLQLARDLHDVVGHSLSMISFRAGVALHVLDRRPEQARVALDAIRSASTEALRELRVTLGTLRDPGGDQGGDLGGESGGDLGGLLGGHRPAPPVAGLARLRALVAEVDQAGRPVDLRVEVGEDELPLAVDLAAFRIVQEALTNVVRHAGPARARVRLAYDRPERAQALLVEVTDDGRGAPGGPRPSGHGHGLDGMRERAAALGGTLTAGPRPGGGFAVSAHLPLGDRPAADPADPADPADAAGATGTAAAAGASTPPPGRGR